ncbi:hypothetical protein [Undibacterium sp. Ji49W]|uniref:hypothetical protein n=1 Tax=Undibacterium sp. Ji49W TaxID=3413040 RepID=UPI003BF271FE
MNKRTHYVALSKVTAGAVLADDLLDKVGHVLLPAGVTLTDHMLHSIAHHEIHQLSIVAAPVSEQQETEEREIRLARLERLFRHAPDSAPASLLKAYVFHYRHGDYQ